MVARTCPKGGRGSEPSALKRSAILVCASRRDADDDHVGCHASTGDFRFIGLEQGWYAVRANVDRPLKPAFDRETSVHLDGCSASTDLLLTVDALAGTVRRSDGSPIGRPVGVTVVAVDRVAVEHRALDFTDNEGRWRVDGLSDGRYLVGINVFQAPTAESPFPPVWYPGVAGSASTRSRDAS